MSPPRSTAILVVSLAGLASAPAAASAAPRRANLVVTSVSRAPSKLGRGGSTPIRVAVRNRGRASAAPAVVRLFLSRDARLSRDDQPLGDGSELPTLRSARTAATRLRAVVPFTARFGAARVIACSDARGAVRESSERDNCRVAAGTLTVGRGGTTPIEPTTAQLIDTALAAHRISAEKATILHVFAQYADPRLPFAYQGASDDGDEHLMTTVRSHFVSFSRATRRTLLPFLLRPMYAGSWWARRYGTTKTKTTAHATAGDVRCGRELDGDWGFVKAKAPVTIWYLDQYASIDRGRAEQLARDIDTHIYPELTKLMGRTPLPDSARTGLDARLGVCDGGDSRYDINLVDLPSSRGGTTIGENGCSETPAFTEESRNQSNLVGFVTHEFMHAIQFAFKNRDGCDNSYWWLDSTADWAIDYVYPANNLEHRFQKGFLDHPDDPLDQRTGTEDPRPYGANVFPFFLARTGRTAAIPASFAAMGSMSTKDAVDQATGGFDSAWPDFARFMVNEPIDPAQAGFDALRKDGQAATAQTTGEDGATLTNQLIDLAPGGALDKEKQVPLTLKALSAKYLWFDSSDGAINSLAIQAPPPADTTVKVELLGKINGRWQRVDPPYDRNVYCRSVPKEAFTQLLFIYANTSKDQSWSAPDDERPRVIASKLACRYRGTSHAEQQLTLSGFPDQVLTQKSDGAGLVFQKLPKSEDDTDKVKFQTSAGTATGSFEDHMTNQFGYDCTTTASANEPLATTPPEMAPGANGYLSINFFGKAGVRGLYNGSGPFTGSYPLQGCDTNGGNGAMIEFFEPLGAPLKAKAADGSISGSGSDTSFHTAPDYLRTTWTLTPY